MEGRLPMPSNTFCGFRGSSPIRASMRSAMYPHAAAQRRHAPSRIKMRALPQCLRGACHPQSYSAFVLQYILIYFSYMRPQKFRRFNPHVPFYEVVSVIR